MKIYVLPEVLTSADLESVRNVIDSNCSPSGLRRCLQNICVYTSTDIATVQTMTDSLRQVLVDLNMKFPGMDTPPPMVDYGRLLSRLCDLLSRMEPKATGGYYTVSDKDTWRVQNESEAHAAAVKHAQSDGWAEVLQVVARYERKVVQVQP